MTLKEHHPNCPCTNPAFYLAIQKRCIWTLPHLCWILQSYPHDGFHLPRAFQKWTAPAGWKEWIIGGQRRVLQELDFPTVAWGVVNCLYMGVKRLHSPLCFSSLRNATFVSSLCSSYLCVSGCYGALVTCPIPLLVNKVWLVFWGTNACRLFVTIYLVMQNTANMTGRALPTALVDVDFVCWTQSHFLTTFTTTRQGWPFVIPAKSRWRTIQVLWALPFVGLDLILVVSQIYVHLSKVNDSKETCEI